MKETTKKEHEQLLDMMQTLFDSDPYVGIFWFDEKELDLVHVTKQELRDARRIGDKIMCSGLHEDYWLKQYRKARAKGLLESPFYGDWTMIPRGRIFYDIPTQTFVCYVGKWYKKYERILRDLILIEFDIPKESFRFQYDRPTTKHLAKVTPTKQMIQDYRDILHNIFESVICHRPNEVCAEIEVYTGFEY